MMKFRLFLQENQQGCINKGNHSQLYNQRRIRAIDFELKKYVKTRKMHNKPIAPESTKNESQGINLLYLKLIC